jgi:glycosyl-4,4'-diaponeurosporenoate acyltransferase
MILYLCIIILGGCVISVANALGFGADMGRTFAIVFVGIVIEILIDGITAAVCRGLPQKCVPYHGKVFQVGLREKNFYEKLHIRKWKDSIPEIGHFTGFRKNKVADPKSEKYLERFLLEIRYGQVGHFVSCISGFLVMLFNCLPFVAWTMTLPIALVNLFLNVLPIFVLRYNGYKLNVLLKSLQKRKAPIIESVKKAY